VVYGAVTTLVRAFPFLGEFHASLAPGGGIVGRMAYQADGLVFDFALALRACSSVVRRFAGRRIATIFTAYYAVNDLRMRRLQVIISA